MAKNPILPLYYNDIDRATRTWTDEEFGAYMRLLIEQWDKGGLPNDYQKLTRLATSLDTNWEFLKNKFELVDGLLKNPVMEEIREKRRKHSEKQSDNVRKRYQKSTKTDTKYLPLENEYEIENEIVNDDKGGVGEKEGIVYPFDTINFKKTWAIWKGYRKGEHNLFYRTLESEQSALRELSRIAPTEQQAIQIIDTAMANTWKNLYKSKEDGKPNSKNNADQRNQDREQELARLMAEQFGGQNS